MIIQKCCRCIQSRTFGDGAVDGDLIENDDHLKSVDQQTSDLLTIVDSATDEQRHESRAQLRTTERACKGGMAAKKRQEKIVKRKSPKVPHGERKALLDRRNESFASRVKTPTARTISIPKMSEWELIFQMR